MNVSSQLLDPTIVLMYPSASTFRSFPLHVPLNFPLNLQTASSYPRSSSKPSDIKFQSVVLSISMFTSSSHTLPPNESLSLVSPFGSGCTQFPCRDSRTVGVGYTLPHPAFVQGRAYLIQQWHRSTACIKTAPLAVHPDY